MFAICLLLSSFVLPSLCKRWDLSFSDFDDPFAADFNNDSVRDFDCRANNCLFPSADVSNGYWSVNECLVDYRCSQYNVFDTYPPYSFNTPFFINLTLHVTQTNVSKALRFYANFGYSSDHVFGNIKSGSSKRFTLDVSLIVFFFHGSTQRVRAELQFYSNASGHQIVNVGWPNTCNVFEKQEIHVNTTEPFAISMFVDPAKSESVLSFFGRAPSRLIGSFRMPTLLSCVAQLQEAQTIFWNFNSSFGKEAKIYEFHVADVTDVADVSFPTNNNPIKTLTKTPRPTNDNSSSTNATNSYSLTNVQSNVGVIVGGSIGALLLLIVMIVVVVLVIVVQRSKRNVERSNNITPNSGSSSTNAIYGSTTLATDVNYGSNEAPAYGSLYF